MVTRNLYIFCLILDNILTLLWAFTMTCNSFPRSGRCVGHVGGGYVGRGYPVGGGVSWLLFVYLSQLSTVSISPSWSERIILGFGDDTSC